MLERYQMDQIKPSSTLAYLYLKFQIAQNKDQEVDQNWITPVSDQIKKTGITFTVYILSGHVIAPTCQKWLCGEDFCNIFKVQKVENLLP